MGAANATPQDLIAGRYRIDRAIGRGGMGTVWLCHDEVLHRIVAVKQIGTVAGEGTGDTRRAMREARSAAALNHRNAVSIYDVVEHEGTPWLVMEYLPSQTLAELMRSGPLPVERVARIGAQVAAALAAAHAAGIIHRDVKPANILVAEGDVAKISDFGIAHPAFDDRLTQTGMTSGTPAYFSPELARGADPSPTADAWALGATLYAAVEGRPPHPRLPNALATLQAIATTPVPRPVRAGLLQEPIGHLMDPDPSTRWTMAEASEALRDLVSRATAGTVPAVAPATAHEPDTASEPTPTPLPVADPEPHRSRFFPVALVVAALLLVGIGAVYLAQTLGADDGADDGDQTATAPTRSEGSSATPEASSTPQPSSSQPSSSQPSSSAPTEDETAPATPAGSAAAREQTVDTYFDTVPDDLDAGWAMLSPAMQDRVGRASYDGFWATIDSTDATDVRAVGADQVAARVTYQRTDGSVATENQVLSLVPHGDGYLIDADR